MVAVASGAQANAGSPLHTYLHLYFSGLESVGEAWDPVVKSFGRCQLEALGLWNRRSQAYFDFPNRLSKCRTPQDVLNEHMHFWHTTFQQYSECANKMVEAMEPFGLTAYGFGQAADDVRNAHEYITFPDPVEQRPAERAPQRRERKVA